MHPQLLSFFGLPWNPFSPDFPVEAIWPSPKLELFARRMTALAREGGFALITGDPGTGKSVALRFLHQQLSLLPDLTVAVLTRPQSRLADFYRELSQLFAVNLIPHNRWAGFKSLREKWHEHVRSTHLRPVLLIDEAQEMLPHVLAELRLLQSTNFDSQLILTVVLCGDARLTSHFSQPDLLPIASRIRLRLLTEYQPQQALTDCLRFALQKANAAHLMTTELMAILTDHAAGNHRTLCHMANELLLEAFQRELPKLDEKLYLELFSRDPKIRLPKRS